MKYGSRNSKRKIERKLVYVDDFFIKTFDKKYALYFYNIDEVSMMAYFANVAIFAQNKFDCPLLSSGWVMIWYDRAKAFTYGQKSASLIFRTSVRKTGKLSYPYLSIKPKTSQFSLIDWDVTSIYYCLEEVNENILLVKEESPQELDRLNYLRRTGEKIDLNALTGYDFAQFDHALEIYKAI